MYGKHIKRAKIKQFPIFSVLNPWFAITLMVLSGLLATIIDKQWYQALMYEPDLMYHNSRLLIFISLCTLSFVLFSYITYRIYSRTKYERGKTISHNNSEESSANLIIFIALLLNFIMLVYIQTTVGISEIARLAFSGGAVRAKLILAEQISTGKVGWIPSFTIIAIMWSFWNMEQHGKKLHRLCLYTVILLYTIISLLSLSRGPLFEMLEMLIPVALLKFYSEKRIGYVKLIRIVILFVILLVFMFFIINSLRNSGANVNSANPIRDLVGYGPASINRLAGLLENKLAYPNSGSYYYSFQGIFEAPIVGGSIRQIGKGFGLNIPLDPQDNWLSQFTFVGAYGFNPSFIWATAFGFIYEDLGYYLTIFWYGLVGIAAGFFYNLFVRRNLIGILLYPIFVSFIVQIWNLPYIVQRSSVVFVLTSLAIFLLNWFLRINRKRHNLAFFR